MASDGGCRWQDEQSEKGEASKREQGAEAQENKLGSDECPVRAARTRTNKSGNKTWQKR